MPYFEKYGKNLFFVAYRRTKLRTTCMRFLKFLINYFKVVHITNNHTNDAAYIGH